MFFMGGSLADFPRKSWMVWSHADDTAGYGIVGRIDTCNDADVKLEYA